MDNKVYYGEYSLIHWVNLILKRNIELPWYQRSFVWDQEQILRLIETFDSNQFIPPVVIGAVKKDGEWKNYILDGQQRLTAILFANINKYVDKKAWEAVNPCGDPGLTADDILDENDDVVDREIKMINWNFSRIIKDKRIDPTEIIQPYYKELLKASKTADFFENHYLGFAYIKPSNDVNEEEQSKFYSDIFRNINTGGTKLTRLESRKSLYFLKETLKEYFAPEFLSNVKVDTSSKESGVIDFIKYISILSQYSGVCGGLSRYGGRDWEKNEKYYKEYIMAIVKQDSSNAYNFDISFPADPYDNSRMEHLKETLLQLSFPRSFNSIIHLDIYFFGLIEQIIFKNKVINVARKEELIRELNAKIVQVEGEDNHKYYPGALKYLKRRIEVSSEVYKKYCIS